MLPRIPVSPAEKAEWNSRLDMRIAYIVTTLGIGGAEKQTIQIAERMHARAHVVLLMVLLAPAEHEWPTELPVVRLNLSRNISGVLKGLRFARTFLTVFGADILHSHTFPANVFARLLRATGSSAKVINTIHNVREGGWMRSMLYRATNRWLTRATAVSEAVRETYVARKLIPAQKISVLRNGIDLDHFQQNKARRSRIRQELNAEGKFVWVAVGRIADAKDYPNLLRAFAIVQNRFPLTRLWIAGENSGGMNARAARELDGLLTQSEGVSCLGFRSDIAALLDAADGFVLSSAWEGMPLVVAEAMAMEKPVIATDVGGVREIIGNFGVTVPARDSSALASAMSGVMTEAHSVLEDRLRSARKRIEQCFSIDSRVEEWEHLYALTIDTR